ncbi:adenylyltransferase/cytidyltransferase family protein [Candidatus Uhrbacteria bacterium]|nr:adenylyltransferase/cytidyltransferase family protein [Candidatus Uhrbacteria bacterium]
MIHPGHLAYLKAAKRLGDELVVVVTRDETAKRRKGRRTACHEKDRMALVRGFRIVDKVVLGDRDDSWRIIMKLRPRTICFGYDQQAAIDSLKRTLPAIFHKNVCIVMAKPFHPKTYHSSFFKLLTPKS